MPGLLNVNFTKLDLFCDPHLHIHFYSCPDEVHNLSSHYRLRRMSIRQSFCLPASPPCQCAVHSSFLKSAGRCFPVLKKERKDLFFFNKASSATSLFHDNPCLTLSNTIPYIFCSVYKDVKQYLFCQELTKPIFTSHIPKSSLIVVPGPVEVLCPISPSLNHLREKINMYYCH